MENKIYLAIDLKSFYASKECVSRGLNPLTTNLVVADKERSEKTICLAVTPALKSFGIPGRARLFEVLEKVKKINNERLKKNNYKPFRAKSYNIDELNNDPSLELDFIIATPRMAKYIEESTKIYSIYLKYISKEDIHVYSIDEVFIDATPYLKSYKLSASELAIKMVKEVYEKTGITATAGIGTNLYLAKVAMDIVAKHMEANEFGVRVASLDEMSYRKLLWDHTPITSFWRVGSGIAKRLEKLGLYTMGDIALASTIDEDRLYDTFGINAELLIDHAWGYEPVTIKDIKEYKPKSNSLSVGQVLSCGYTKEKGLLIVKEMCDLLALDLVDKGLLTNELVLSVGYDIENLKDYDGPMALDYINRMVPKPAHGSILLKRYISSSKYLIGAIEKLYNEIVNNDLLVRRMYIGAINLIPKDKKMDLGYMQFDIFSNPEEKIEAENNLTKDLESENKLQHAIINIQKKYGKNSVLKGMNYEEGATTKERNKQIGGHKAWVNMIQ